MALKEARTARATQKNPVSKNKQTNKQTNKQKSEDRTPSDLEISLLALPAFPMRIHSSVHSFIETGRVSSSLG